MNNKFNIPKTLNIGYQKREDTYTGKLAYVTYTDAKGVLRKEPSWNYWRDKKIEPSVYENKPISGFVLNRNGGGKCNSYSSWNPRNEFIRVYDPRGFEFEISLANLLFILQECTSIKGKGLEGEFVYAWDRADLVLLPVSSQEYQNSLIHTELQTKKFSAKDLIEGEIYLFKDGSHKMYIGKHNYYNHNRITYWRDYGKIEQANMGKKYFFYDMRNKDKQRTEHSFCIESGITKVADKTDIPKDSVLFVELYQYLIESEEVEPGCEFVFKKIPFKRVKERIEGRYNCFLVTKGEDGYYLKYIREYNKHENDKEKPYIYKDFKLDMTNISLDSIHYVGASDNFSHYDYQRMNKISEEELNSLQFFYLVLVNKYNKECLRLSAY